MMEISEKNLRRQKNQRSSNKKAYLSKDKSSKAENSSSSSQHNNSEPQPQRVNRRDRNEQQTTEASSLPKVSAKSEVVQPPIDHSHLKRETEDIEKLTKKFSKREISSNWSRYSVSEDIATNAPAEEEALADFTDLLQVPPSNGVAGGGHLQLKEEQNWSSASDALLNGYFALDLKMLSQGLSCIPAYEQLQLPQRIFNEEEINIFHNCGEQAKQCYQADKMENPSENVLCILKKLVVEEVEPNQIHKLENSINQTEDICNPLDITTKCKQNFLDLDMSLDNNKNSSESLNNDTKSIENMLTSANKSKNLDNSKNSYVIFNETLTNTDSSTEHSKTSIKLDSNCLYSSDKKNLIEPFEEPRAPITNTISLSKSYVNVVTVERENSTSAKIPCLTEDNNRSSERETSLFMSSEQHKVDFNEASNKNIQAVKTVSPVKAIKTTNSQSKSVSLEDDDDLDFLLALKTPVLSQKINEKSETSAIVKESRFLPGDKTLQPSASDTHSELDSWLDSVLED